MMAASDMRSPAPRAYAENRVEVRNRNDFPFTTIGREPESDFAAVYIARHYRLAPTLARAVAVLAGLGRAFG